MQSLCVLFVPCKWMNRLATTLGANECCRFISISILKVDFGFFLSRMQQQYFFVFYSATLTWFEILNLEYRYYERAASRVMLKLRLRLNWKKSNIESKNLTYWSRFSDNLYYTSCLEIGECYLCFQLTTLAFSFNFFVQFFWMIDIWYLRIQFCKLRKMSDWPMHDLFFYSMTNLGPNSLFDERAWSCCCFRRTPMLLLG